MRNQYCWLVSSCQSYITVLHKDDHRHGGRVQEASSPSLFPFQSSCLRSKWRKPYFCGQSTELSLLGGEMAGRASLLLMGREGSGHWSSCRPEKKAMWRALKTPLSPYRLTARNSFRKFLISFCNNIQRTMNPESRASRMRKKQSEVRVEWMEKKHNWLIKNHHLNSRLDTAENQFNEVKDKFKTFSFIHMGKFERYRFIVTEKNDQRCIWKT